MQNLVKTDLEKLGCKNVIINDNEIKAHFKELKGFEISRLNFINSQGGVTSVEIKRSGTGLTVIVKVN